MSETSRRTPSQLRSDVGNNERLYSIYEIGQKRCIIVLVAFAAWFSTVSSFIYFPAISLLANDLHVSIEDINLTVTSYLVVSGLAPSVTGSCADTFGRRPAILVALLVYVTSNIGLAVQTSFVALFLVRMVQSAGVSGTFAIAYGVISDIASPAERGSYVGIVSFGTNTAPSLGPLFGGLLAGRLGWRAIFWFLSVASAGCLLAIIFAFPETSRKLVGNGSIEAIGISRLPFTKVYGNIGLGQARIAPSSDRRLQLANPITCIRCLLQKDNAIIIFAMGILYTIYSCLQASLSSLFVRLYGLTELQAGLIYLPFGLSCAAAAYLTGQLLDRDYRLTAIAHGLPVDKASGNDLDKFPIEFARLRSIFYPLSLAAASIAGYGWAVQAKTVCFEYLLAALTAKTLNTLLIDLNSNFPSTAQAANNLVRCTLAAIGLAILQIMIDILGIGWCFTVWAILGALCVPLLLQERANGMKWRLRRLGTTIQEGSATPSSPTVQSSLDKAEQDTCLEKGESSH